MLTMSERQARELISDLDGNGMILADEESAIEALRDAGYIANDSPVYDGDTGEYLGESDLDLEEQA